MPDYDALAKRFQGVDYDALAAQASQPQAPPSPSVLNTLLDVAKGFGKGAAHTALDLGDLAGKLPVDLFDPTKGNLRGAIDKLYGQPGLSEAAFSDARQRSAYTNNAQRAGGAAETVAEMALPIGEAAKAVPTVGKAGAKFQSVMSAAKNVPIDVNAPGKVALRISELAERGGSMPKAARDFLKRVTDPKKGDMTYQEARDFASNISRISADEFNRLTPVIKREMGELRVALNESVAKAAEKAGKGAEYKSAMREYAQAMKIRDVINSAVEGVKKAAPYATVGGASAYLASKLGHLWASE